MSNLLFNQIFLLTLSAISIYAITQRVLGYNLQKRKDAYLKQAIDQYMKLIPKVMGQIRKAAGEADQGTWEDLSRDMAEQLTGLISLARHFDASLKIQGVVLSRQEKKEADNAIMNAEASLKNFNYYCAMQEEKND